ncbi:MAG: hypothetical protein MR594_09685 [Lachnospiraceae bacterium]|nr:hypothetical protein [Lachnospiraceae bacterium]
MKRKTLSLLSILTISATLLSGCKSADSPENSETIETTAIESEITEGTEESKVELLPWLQLASLETHPELRSAFEDLLGITTEDDGTKSGVVYTDENGDRNQNNTLFNALGNTNFTISYIRDAEQSSKIEEIANNEYTDIEDNQGVAAVINAYFELLPDQEDGQFDGDATISRSQAMTLVMRATTPVNDAQAPEANDDFTSKVGESQYTNFAAPMNQYSYLNTSNGLTDKTFNTTMSRGEYIYMLTKCIYGDSYAQRMGDAGKEDETLSDDLSLTNIKDGGDITFQEALNNPENGLPTEMYQTLARAVALGFISEDTLNWDEAITKSEAINLFIDAVETSYGNSMFVTNKDGTPEATNSEGLTVDEAIKADYDYMDELVKDYEGDIFTKYDAYVKDQGADELCGAWLIYYYGSAAGDQRSYAINQRTGEKMVAGPDSFFYGTSLNDDGAEPFWGTDKTYPGDTFPEFEENMTLAIEGKPAHTNGQ